MKKQPQGIGPAFDVEDAFGNFLDSAAKFLFWAGLVLTLASIGLLITTYSAFASGTPPAAEAQALANIALLGKVLIAGMAGLIVGSTYMFWGEEILGVIQLMGAGLVFFSPLIIPSVIAGTPNAVTKGTLGAIQQGGMVGAVLAIGVLVADIMVRIKARAKMGTKADQLKYGKGVKEEAAVQNVFLGKCWQLPFCRKFVREKCPIYHARRSCWKERVGCMCEEEVIRGAMEGRAIPKDVVAAAKYIPVNNKLSDKAKFERCKVCVIYNEHQKHKYKAALPVTLLIFIGAYVGLRQPLLEATGGMMRSLDRVLGGLTFNATSGKVTDTVQKTPVFQEILLICMLIVLLAYALRFLEYAFFKLKV